MNEWWIVVTITAVIGGLWLWWTATRMDRLHGRVETTHAVLETQLVRRGAAAAEIAASGILDPASSLVLADAAAGVRAVAPEHRERAENDLTHALVATFPDLVETATLAEQSGAQDLINALVTSCRDVEMARRFHNDSVRSALRLRRRRRVQLFGLAGGAPWPETVEFDDTVPTGLRL